MNDKEIRVAWYDRETNKYDFGSWRDFKYIEQQQRWVTEQNKLYPKTKFWVEYRENKEGVVKNVEEVVFIKIEKDNSQYNDYLMVE
tara:strand:+ start:513 stop:770 length:258 start_codon:yes stop_codon:yes gene_type:complete